MRYAYNLEGGKVAAEKGIIAFCYGCKTQVIPKCGKIKIHHFAHKGTDCDPWYEPESQWHRDWKDFFSKEEQEVVIGRHRADVKTKGMVVELQNSPISSEEIVERESFYGNMIWVVNAQSFYDERFFVTYKDDYCSFLWKHPRRCWEFAKKPVYLDIGATQLFLIKKIYPNSPCRGWGVVHGKEWLLGQLGVTNIDVNKL